MHPAIFEHASKARVTGLASYLQAFLLFQGVEWLYRHLAWAQYSW